MAQIKTAVSLDRTLYEQVDVLAKKMKVPRSRLFTMALQDFLRRHDNEQLLQEINKAYPDEADPARQTLRSGMRRIHRKILEGQW
jgi:metal-responsive CopG/Arc/MetJ family transcriptional regulator